MGPDAKFIVTACIFFIIGLLFAVPQWRRFKAYKKQLNEPIENNPQQGTDVLYSSLLDNNK